MGWGTKQQNAPLKIDSETIKNNYLVPKKNKC